MRVPIDTAAHICGVKPGTIYRWAADKRITTERGPDGANWYDVDELLQWIDARDTGALFVRAGIPGDQATRMAIRGGTATKKNRVRSHLEESA